MENSSADKQAQRFIVGLTGGIGSGKSAATQFFAALGVDVVDADVMSRVVVQQGRPALQAIAVHFGQGILQPDSTLHRSALRKIVFDNPTEKAWLEQLLHPLIRQEIEQKLRSAGSRYAILSSPLLLETGQDTLTNRVLVIDAPEQQQIARTQTRDNTTEEAVTAIMATQWSRAQRLERADDIVVNDGDLAQLEREVQRLHELYLQEST